MGTDYISGYTPFNNSFNISNLMQNLTVNCLFAFVAISREGNTRHIKVVCYCKWGDTPFTCFLLLFEKRNELKVVTDLRKILLFSMIYIWWKTGGGVGANGWEGKRWKIENETMRGKVENHHYVLFAVGITSIGETGLHLLFHVSHFNSEYISYDS